MPNGFNNQFDGDKFNSLMSSFLTNAAPNLQNYIGNILGQSAYAFLSSAFSPPQQTQQPTPPPAQSAAQPAGQQPGASPFQQFFTPNMQNFLIQLLQTMLIPPKKP